MTPSTALSALTNLLREQTGLAVALGAPDGSAAALRVWPWQIADSMATANAPPVRSPEGSIEQPPPRVDVRLLLLPGPGPAASQVENLARAHRVLLNHPVLAADGATAQVSASALPVDQLAPLFLAAGVRLTLASSFTLRCTL